MFIMQWFGILALLFLLFALAGFVYIGANTDKLGFGFGKYVFNGARTFNTHRVDSIRKLRDLTGSPITECKKALEDSNYELENAILLLQKHGKTIVDHKASIMINY